MMLVQIDCKQCGTFHKAICEGFQDTVLFDMYRYKNCLEQGHTWDFTCRKWTKEKSRHMNKYKDLEERVKRLEEIKESINNAKAWIDEDGNLQFAIDGDKPILRGLEVKDYTKDTIVTSSEDAGISITEIVDDLEALIKKKKKIKHKEVWPKEGDVGYILRTSNYEETGLRIISGEIYNHDTPYSFGFYKTKEDAEIMRDWYLAQQLDWMPEEGEGWWSWRGAYTQLHIWENYGTPGGVHMADYVRGNVFRTGEEAERYGELRKKAAEIKLKYLKLKEGV